MSDFNNRTPWGGAIPAQADTSVDAGLRAFMLGVYNKLGLGLVLAGALAYVTGNVPAVSDLLFRTAGGHLVGYTPLGMIVSFAPLAMLLISMFAMRNPTASGANLLYWGVVSTMGASLGMVFLAYTGGAIYSTFFVTAAAFAGLSLWGYVTKRNLTGFGSFLIMGLWGIIIAGVVNMFLHSSGLYFIINLVAVFVFAGLIAYQTQQLKMTYYAMGQNQVAMSVMTSYGALGLFINFVNLFLTLLQIFGGNRR